MNTVRQELSTLLNVEPRLTGFRATLHAAPTLPLFPDHFPTNPILPAICMIQAAILAAQQSQNTPTLKLRTIQKAKFTYPVRPNDQLIIEAAMTQPTPTTFTLTAKLSVAEKPCAEFTLHLEANP